MPAGPEFRGAGKASGRARGQLQRRKGLEGRAASGSWLCPRPGPPAARTPPCPHVSIGAIASSGGLLRLPSDIRSLVVWQMVLQPVSSGLALVLTVGVDNSHCICLHFCGLEVWNRVCWAGVPSEEIRSWCRALSRDCGLGPACSTTKSPWPGGPGLGAAFSDRLPESPSSLPASVLLETGHPLKPGPT